MAVEELDVLIVGAGPTGLALAAELKRLGAGARIIDRQAAGANTSRAAVVHARTLEVLEPLGAAARLLGRGLKVPVFRVRDRDRTLATVDFSGVPSAYPFTLLCPQDVTESILLEILEELGGEVDRPSELLSLEHQPGWVAATVASGERQRKLRARWLVGCDGMHSRVRELAGIPFEGGEYPQSFVLADVQMDWPLGRDEVSLYLSPEGLMLIAPLPGGRFRVVATMEDAPEQLPLATLQALIDRRGPSMSTGRIQDVMWRSRFRVHHRLAASPRRDRILLCGDAAHVHSPAGGQGMNTGIQDAVSLAGALARTLADGWDARLDEWAAERHRVAKDVVAFTDLMTRAATLRSPAARAIRNGVMTFAGRLPPVRAALARRIAELEPPRSRRGGPNGEHGRFG